LLRSGFRSRGHEHSFTDYATYADFVNGNADIGNEEIPPDFVANVADRHL
jgi:hypothetical protein